MRGLHVGVCDADELGLAVPSDVDVAAVGDARDDELRHPPQQFLVVERPGQLLRRLEQEREPGARPLGLVLGLRPFDDRRKMVGDRSRKEDLAVAPLVRRVSVQDEPPKLQTAAHRAG